MCLTQRREGAKVLTNHKGHEVHKANKNFANWINDFVTLVFFVVQSWQTFALRLSAFA